VSQYQKSRPKTNLDITEARDSEWQWHQLGYMQICTLLQTDNHTSTPNTLFLQAGCPSCRPTNSVKALKAQHRHRTNKYLDTLLANQAARKALLPTTARDHQRRVVCCNVKYLNFEMQNVRSSDVKVIAAILRLSL